MGASKIPEGALTALVTPFNENGDVDWDGLVGLATFQIYQGISGIVPVGTTGESPTLTEIEHKKIISYFLSLKSEIFTLAGCGSNCTAEASDYVRKVAESGGRAVLLVDPYYNGPSSLELRMEYYGPIAKAFPNIAIVPYIIPGRTGCKLMPWDLAALNKEFPNVLAVKEATGDFDNMEAIGSLMPPEFQIFSGDDDKTFDMMTMQTIKACGVISVVSNIVPKAVQKMCQAILTGDIAKAETIRDELSPLFKVVTVLANRATPPDVTDKFRNPLPIKTMMNALGMPAGPCRQPLGKMSSAGVKKVRGALSTVWSLNPEVLHPIEEYFNVDIGKRLADDKLWAKLSY